MRRLMTKKNLTIYCASLLCGCAPQAQQATVCHQWSSAEKQQHYSDDIALPSKNSLHDIIKDYERICLNLQ